MARKRIGDYNQSDVDEFVGGGWRKSWVGRQTPFGLVSKVVLALIALSIVLGVVGYIGGWLNEGKRIVSPANVRAAWREAYRLDRDLTAQARIVCRTAQSNGLAETVSGSPLLAVQTTYDRIQGQYDELVSNKLEKGLVLPPDLPSRDKTLTDRLGDPDVGCPREVITRISGGLK